MSRLYCLAVGFLVFAPCACSLVSSEWLDASAEARPVSKVISLLQDMLKQMEKEGKEDQETYDKMSCWCDTNEKAKTKAIADAEARIAELASKIEELSATSMQLTAEIKKLEKEIALAQEALSEATTLREKELAEFNALEKDFVTSIGALHAAVVILSKHSKSQSFLQMPGSPIKTVATAIQKAMQKHASLLKKVFTPAERQVVDSFLQKTSGPYEPASGQVFGIISQMKESFEKSLAATQKDEAEKSAAFEELKAAKEKEIAASVAKRTTKRQQLAVVDEKLADAKMEKKHLEAMLFADQQFLAKLKEKCKLFEDEFGERQTTRAEETQAVSDALAVLSTDEAHDMFSKALKPSFLQKKKEQEIAKAVKATRKKHVDEAASLLSNVAQRVHSNQLSALAVRVRLDSFTEVKKAIDAMIDQLLKQQQDEVKAKDECSKEINENGAKTEKKTRQKVAAESLVSDLKQSIADIAAKIEDLTAQIEELKTQLTIAGNDRNYEHKDFVETVEDQKSAQKLLVAAKTVLSKYYEKSKATLVLRQQGAHQQAPPPGFSEYKDQSGEAAIDMLEKIIKDAVKVSNEAITAESDAQRAYEEFVKDSNVAIDAKTSSLIEYKETKANKEGDLQAAQAELEAATTDLEQLASQLEDLKQSCDYVLKNFATRQKARDEEVTSLKQAKQILSGATMLLEKKVHPVKAHDWASFFAGNSGDALSKPSMS